MIKAGKAADYRDRDSGKAVAVNRVRGVVAGRTELEACEAAIDGGMSLAKNAFRVITQNVAKVKDGELWRQGGYSGFEDWCQKKYGWSGKRGYQLASAELTLESLPAGNSTIVENEAQARALAAVPKEQRIEVLKTVAKSGAVTAKRITEAAVPRQKPHKIIDIEPEPKAPVKHCPTCRCG